MNERLRPQTLGEILDRTAQIYRSRFLVFFGIAVVPAGILVVFAAAFFLYLSWSSSDAANLLPQTSRVLVGIVVLSVMVLVALPSYVGATALGWAALTDASARAFLDEPISIRESYRTAWKKGWRYFWLCLLAAAIVFVAPFAVFFVLTMSGGILTAFAGRAGMGDLSAFLGGFMVLLTAGLGLYALFALLRVSFAFPVSVVEQISAWSSIKRTYLLSRDTKGRIFLLFLLGAALGWILVLGMSIPLFIALSLVPGMSNPEHAQKLGQIFGFVWYGLSFAVQAFTRPVYGIALTLFYFDQRIRTEGLDIEWNMRDAGLIEEAAPPAESAPVQAPLFAQQELPASTISLVFENETLAVSEPGKPRMEGTT
ncbi:MAG TPA: hypothetical protein VK716_17580 [Terracidiphilus sp.]|jgi:hypothetical protein|nr:hypothetical protein [Terracidiphilus sp.]